jgi:hypothetical protein
LASSRRFPAAWDSGVHQVSALLIDDGGGHQITIHRMTPGERPPPGEQVRFGWLSALRAYLGVRLALGKSSLAALYDLDDGDARRAGIRRHPLHAGRSPYRSQLADVGARDRR